MDKGLKDPLVAGDIELRKSVVIDSTYSGAVDKNADSACVADKNDESKKVVAEFDEGSIVDDKFDEGSIADDKCAESITASDDEILAISRRIFEKNKEAYEVLAQ